VALDRRDGDQALPKFIRLGRGQVEPAGLDVRSAAMAVEQEPGGNVLVVWGAWTQPFLDEHAAFPVGRSKDQVDAAAFNLIADRSEEAIRGYLVADLRAAVKA